MNSPSLPSWSFWLMGLGLAGFALLLVQMIRRNKGIRRSFYAWPYTLWMIISTIVPLCILMGVYLVFSFFFPEPILAVLHDAAGMISLK